MNRGYQQRGNYMPNQIDINNVNPALLPLLGGLTP